MYHTNLNTFYFHSILSLKRSPVASTSRANISVKQQPNVYDADTDIDSDADIRYPDDILADESIEPLPCLEKIFHNCSFYLATSLKPILKIECHRYIVALKG